jgi:hypothetical protein
MLLITIDTVVLTALQMYRIHTLGELTAHDIDSLSLLCGCRWSTTGIEKNKLNNIFFLVL